MNAGKLNKRITLQRFIPERSASNQKTKGHYEDAFTVWADVRCTQSSSSDAEGVAYFNTVYKIYIRKRDDITANMRIRYGDKTLELTGEPVDWKNETGGLTLIAKEVT